MIVHRNSCAWPCLNVKSKAVQVHIDFWTSTLVMKLSRNGQVSAALPHSMLTIIIMIRDMGERQEVKQHGTVSTVIALVALMM